MDPLLHQEFLQLACQLAEEVAPRILASAGERPCGTKSDRSVVTATDQLVQDFIIAAIAERYPDHGLIAEESMGPVASNIAARYCWVVDPIDGTRNFVTRFPCFATSIALLDDGRPVVAVVREHNLGHVYAARIGGGTTLNGERVGVYTPPATEDWLVGGPSTKEPFTTRVLQAWITTEGLIYRNVGSSAVHLCWVASGTLSAAFAKRCKIWDIAAGMLLVSEAGGIITGPKGEDLLPLRLSDPPEADIPFIAGSPVVHAKLLEMIRPLA